MMSGYKNSTIDLASDGSRVVSKQNRSFGARAAALATGAFLAFGAYNSYGQDASSNNSQANSTTNTQITTTITIQNADTNTVSLQKYNLLKSERDSLEDQLECMNISYSSLEDRFTATQTSNNVLSSDVKRSAQEISILQKQIKDLDNEINSYRAELSELNARDLAGRVAEERAMKEGALVYQLITSSAFTAPAYPWATTEFDDSTRTFGNIGEVPFLSSPEGRFIDNIAELKALGKGIAAVYQPTFPNSKAFEQLCASAGLEASFAYSVEGYMPGFTYMDALAQFVGDFGKAQKSNPKNPVVLSINTADKALLLGNYETLKRIKGGSL
ncbi:MAG: hypothetical protein Q8Q31_00670 [Nanoarchaeota archaeon]|nr:hypothetical protein [Nanoarchaeota archaeon]